LRRQSDRALYAAPSTRRACTWIRSRRSYPPCARSSSATSILTICSMACMTRCALA
jgi:hypothetical protein